MVYIFTYGILNSLRGAAAEIGLDMTGDWQLRSTFGISLARYNSIYNPLRNEGMSQTYEFPQAEHPHPSETS